MLSNLQANCTEENSHFYTNYLQSSQCVSFCKLVICLNFSRDTVCCIRSIMAEKISRKKANFAIAKLQSWGKSLIIRLI